MFDMPWPHLDTVWLPIPSTKAYSARCCGALPSQSPLNVTGCTGIASAEISAAENDAIRYQINKEYLFALLIFGKSHNLIEKTDVASRVIVDDKPVTHAERQAYLKEQEQISGKNTTWQQLKAFFA
ncbi:uncharacterized protein I206_106305 [Kwoniella pini CBS 10737]|uniref:Uncharacterized protein n=1 Tax=Kwoniella pini CBS 10737 TaxID=1296096 RepID=A0A1B9HTY0_9TREE|nr:uncharacterized protein I206_07107 [Kwoniella pini CBS 10737]OCF46720.1 hypothetical protein I206_07107 [Kwoniella pini CBS 10737]